MAPATSLVKNNANDGEHIGLDKADHDIMMNGAVSSSAIRDAIKGLQRDPITKHIDETEMMDTLNSAKLQDSIAEYHKATKSEKFHERLKLPELCEAGFGEVNHPTLTQKNYHGFSGIVLGMHS